MVKHPRDSPACIGPGAAATGFGTVRIMPDDMLLTALDIETDTSDGVNGLDPTSSRVVAVALAFNDRVPVVFDDADEATLLRRLDEALRVRTGLLMTWNGAGFDIPFLVARAAALGVDLSCVIRRDPALPVKYDPPPGLGCAVHARWAELDHVDVSHLYRLRAAAVGVAWSLKPVARHMGLQPVEVDRTAIHELTATELHDYVVSDAVITLELARRLAPETLVAAITRP